MWGGSEAAGGLLGGRTLPVTVVRVDDKTLGLGLARSGAGRREEASNARTRRGGYRDHAVFRSLSSGRVDRTRTEGLRGDRETRGYSGSRHGEDTIVTGCLRWRMPGNSRRGREQAYRPGVEADGRAGKRAWRRGGHRRSVKVQATVRTDEVLGQKQLHGENQPGLVRWPTRDCEGIHAANRPALGVRRFTTEVEASTSCPRRQEATSTPDEPRRVATQDSRNGEPRLDGIKSRWSRGVYQIDASRGATGGGPRTPERLIRGGRGRQFNAAADRLRSSPARRLVRPGGGKQRQTPRNRRKGCVGGLRGAAYVPRPISQRRNQAVCALAWPCVAVPSASSTNSLRFSPATVRRIEFSTVSGDLQHPGRSGSLVLRGATIRTGFGAPSPGIRGVGVADKAGNEVAVLRRPWYQSSGPANVNMARRTTGPTHLGTATAIRSRGRGKPRVVSAPQTPR